MWGFASSPLVTEGVVIVHAGGAASLEGVELAKFPAIEGKTWNHPAIAGGRLIKFTTQFDF